MNLAARLTNVRMFHTRPKHWLGLGHLRASLKLPCASAVCIRQLALLLQIRLEPPFRPTWCHWALDVVDVVSCLTDRDYQSTTALGTQCRLHGTKDPQQLCSRVHFSHAVPVVPAPDKVDLQVFRTCSEPPHLMRYAQISDDMSSALLAGLGANYQRSLDSGHSWEWLQTRVLKPSVFH